MKRKASSPPSASRPARLAPLPSFEELGRMTILAAKRDIALRALSDENAALREENAFLRERLEALGAPFDA